ncbi:hypothetical protein AB4Z54_63260, partial [Streptomyces sp. MCAF7]
ALLLADRVLVMDHGVIAYERQIGLDRPRDISDPRFAELRTELLDRLGVAAPTATPTAAATTAPTASPATSPAPSPAPSSRKAA